QVTVDNYAELCLGAPPPAEGLGFIPAGKEGPTVCLLALRIIGGARGGGRAGQKPAAETAVLQSVAEKMGGGEKYDFSSSRVRFGWAPLEAESALGKRVASLAAGSAAGPAPAGDSVLLVAIDWGGGWMRIRRGGWSESEVDVWVRETVKHGEAAADWGGVVPGFSLTSVTEAGGASSSHDAETGDRAHSGGWSLGLGLVFALLAAGQYLIRVLGHAGQTGGGGARRPPAREGAVALGERRGGARQGGHTRKAMASLGDGPLPLLGRLGVRLGGLRGGAPGGASPGQSQGGSSGGGGSSTSGNGSSGSSGRGPAGGRQEAPSPSPSPPQGASSRDAGASPGGGKGGAQLEERLANLSPSELVACPAGKEAALPTGKKLNISDCSEKHEIVTRILASIVDS
ncbi:hypothetical protein T484DRAFT_1777727, partial [Baffinella frigidus]